MKIAIVQPRVSYYAGGGEKVPLIHINYLLKNGHKVILYTTKIAKKKQSFLYKKFLSTVSAHLKIRQYKIPKKYKFIYLKEPGQNRNRWDSESLLFNQLIFKDLDNDNPDVVISYYILDGVFRPTNLPAVLYLCGYPSDQLEIRKSFLRFFDSTISISNNVKKQWGGHLNEVKRNYVLNSGVEVNINNKKIKSKYSLNLVFAGRLVKRKGLITLLKAMRLIIQKYPKTHLWIIGDGPQKQELINKISNMGLGNHTTMTGLLENIGQYFKMADICIFPSYKKEGLMGVVLEAMSAGKAVISTTNNGNEDIIENGVNGILIKPKNIDQLVKAISELIDDKQKRQQIGKKAKQYVLDNLTWETFIKKYINILKQIKK